MKACTGPCQQGRIARPCPEACEVPEKDWPDTALALMQRVFIAIAFAAFTGVIAGLIG